MLIQLTVYKCGSFVNIHFILKQFPDFSQQLCLFARLEKKKYLVLSTSVDKFKSIHVPFREKYSIIIKTFNLLDYYQSKSV